MHPMGGNYGRKESMKCGGGKTFNTFEINRVNEADCLFDVYSTPFLFRPRSIAAHRKLA